MATPVPTQPNAGAASQPASRIAPKRMGFDPLRPARQGYHFVAGTIGNSLDTMAGWGRMGMWAGVGFGLMAMIAGGGIGALLVWGVGGLVAGSLLGGTFGAVTGGLKSAGREQRKEKYADDLAARASAREQRPARGVAPAPGYDYRDAYDHNRRVSNFNFDRSQQQARENDQDYSTYWQDKHAAEQVHNNFDRNR